MNKSSEHTQPTKAEQIKSAKYDIQVATKLLDKAIDRYLGLTGWFNFGSSPEGIWVNPGIPNLPEAGVTEEEALGIQWELDSDLTS